MNLTTRTIRSPGDALYREGEKCPSGTPDAGKKGVVLVRYWSGVGLSEKQGKNYSGNPQGLKLGNGQLITMGFAPAGTQLPKPNGTVVAGLLNVLSQSPSSTSTTTPAVTTTTAPSSTTTTAPPSTTTTAPRSTTSTTKK
jgi:hypothetical protein